jgi:allantoicase
VVACLPLDPRFAGSNPAKDDGLLRVIKIRSTTVLRRGRRRSHVVDLRHVKEPYEHEKMFCRQKNSAAMFLTHVSPASLPDGSSRRIRIE